MGRSMRDKSCIAVRLMLGAGLACAAQLACSQQAVEVFGLPLGGKIEPMKTCSSDYTKRKSVCWNSAVKPYKDGEMFGWASLPDSSVPVWATTQVQIRVSKGWVLESMQFLSDEGMWRNREKIVQSISARFGPPEQGSHSNTSWAIWQPQHNEISLGCMNGKCYLHLLSESAVKTREAIKAKANSRPATL
jgi:hypothetical protein